MREGCCVAVDSDDLVYVFCRGNMPVLVFDIEGELVNAWGNPTPFAGSHVYTDPYGNSAAGWVGNEWVSTHGIFIDHEEHLWLVDHVGHTITKATKEGKRLMIICPHGVVAKNDDEIAKIVSTGGFTEPAELQSGLPFNKPTDCWVGAAASPSSSRSSCPCSCFWLCSLCSGSSSCLCSSSFSCSYCSCSWSWPCLFF